MTGAPGTGVLNLAWADCLVGELVRAGVRRVCLAPGSRSAPLALAAARWAQSGEVELSVHIDERSAAFRALGHGLASGRPSAVVCTSGTAAANFLPAVIEAHYGAVPIVLLTADRPAELRETGAWQSIDQTKLYGGYPRWFFELPTPSRREILFRTLRTVADRAVATATAPIPGPVHLNVPFREPLLTVSGATPDWGAADALTAGMDSQAGAPRRRQGEGPAPGRAPAQETSADVAMPTEMGGPAPWVTHQTGRVVPDTTSLQAAAARLGGSARGVIVAGRLRAGRPYAAAVAELGRATGFPILAESTGGLRFGLHNRAGLLAGYDAYLRDPAWRRAHAPEVVVQFGATPVWRQAAEFLDLPPAAHRIFVDPLGAWDDPARGRATRIVADPTEVATGLVGLVGRRPRSTEWREAWHRADAAVAAALQPIWDRPQPGTTLWLPQMLVEAPSSPAALFAANSMAVRDIESFTRPSPAELRVLANRGAAGIDGTLSSGLGVAEASGLPTVLLTGDLAFLHDINGLQAAGGIKTPVAVVVANDDGGGIFSYLPYADLKELPRLFQVPTGAELAGVCHAYHVPHRLAAKPADARRLVAEALARPGVSVVEIPVDRAANTAAHMAYWAEVSERLA